MFETSSQNESPPLQGESPSAGAPRLRVAQRDQVVIRMLALEQMLPPDDEARVVWAFVEQCDLTPLYQPIRAVAGHAGRDATDPKILVALWLFATLKGSGRHASWTGCASGTCRISGCAATCR